MRLRLVEAGPEKAPTREDVQITGDVQIDRELFVRVGGLAFRVWREEGSPDLIGLQVLAAVKGAELSLPYFLAAQGLAVEAMNTAVRGERSVLRCPECERILSSAVVEMQRNTEEPSSIECAVPHLVHFGEYVVLV